MIINSFLIEKKLHFKSGFFSFFYFALIGLGISGELFAGEKNDPKSQKPKLVVGIIVDQMRFDYVNKYWNRYSEGGFKRMVNHGYFFTNTHYNYVPTYTAPGHASVYTGTTPSNHGIVGNEWYQRIIGKNMYCVEDGNCTTIGSNSSFGNMSPSNLLTSTIGDELKLFSQKRSKVIGISLKDRGAILPAGHSGNAAYWYDGSNGNWITSSYYMKQLPGWVNSFNEKKLADKYISQPWNTLYPIGDYKGSMGDDNAFEEPFIGESKPVFPHDIPKLRSTNQELEILRSTPFGNSILKDFAIETIKSENLGKGSDIDLLALSFSSTDYIGHQFGTHSIEVEDTYLRLDKDLAELLVYLDEFVGKGNYLVFLTADHGASDVPSYLTESKIPSGYLSSKTIADSLENFFYRRYGQGKYISGYTNHQFFLNETLLESKNLRKRMVAESGVDYVLNLNGIHSAYSFFQIRNSDFYDGIGKKIKAGFHKDRCGDILVQFAPGVIEYKQKGTTHGSGYNYDTHVPLIWYGTGIPKGMNNEYSEIIDIAPTISQMLQISFPNASSGRVLEFE